MATRKTGPLARPPAIGEIFTRWSVLGKAPSRREDHGSRAYVQCRCECGTEREVMVKSLRSGSSRSCGCLMLQAISERKSAVGECYGHVTVIAEAEDRFRPSGAYTRHVRAQCGCGRVFETSLFHLQRGHTTSCGHPSHRMTHGMHDTPTYRTWMSMHQRCRSKRAASASFYRDRGIAVCERWGSFANFLEDMGEKPPRLTLDRIDNDGNYEPGNCRWATRVEQARNRRTNVWVEYDGARMVLADAARAIGVGAHRVSNRVRERGITHQAAFDYFAMGAAATANAHTGVYT